MGKLKKRSGSQSHSNGNRKKKQKTVPNTAPPDTTVMKAVPDCSPSDEPQLETKITEWLQQQAREECCLVGQDIEDTSTEDDEVNEEDEKLNGIVANIEVQFKHRLKGLSEDDKSKRYKYECEWNKCVFMSGADRKYFRHVEDHAYMAARNENQSYECEWDLCKFRHRYHPDFVGHVHFHAHHTKLKVHGASLSMLMKFPSCNYDSRTRNNVSGNATSYTCEWNDCDEKFNKAMEFYHHVRCHVIDMFPLGSKHVDAALPCGWSICKRTFLTLANGIKHTKTHTKEREIGCFTCGATFFERTRYRDHCNRQLDMAYRKYECAICDRYFATMRLLKTHQESHKLEYACPQCPLKFSVKSQMARHVRHIHIKIRPFSCTQCEYRALSKDSLQKHMMTHTTEKLFRCDEFGCNATFKLDQSLKRHIAKHYFPPNNYGCHICGNVYNFGWLLSKHLNSVHHVLPPPGASRYRYKLDEDGMSRLSTFVDAQRDSRRKPVLPPTDPDRSDTEEPIVTDPSLKGDAINTCGAEPPTAAGHVYGEPQIKHMAMIGANEIAIDLGLDFANKEDEVASREPAVLNSMEKEKCSPHNSKENFRPVETTEENSANKPKKVQEFTVMQHYLKIG